MNRYLGLFLLSIFLYTTSCNCLKGRDHKSRDVVEETVKTYQVVVSFISKGSGIDAPRVEALNTMTADFAKKVNKEITPIEVGWGREGERDYYFDLNGVSETDQLEFIQALQSTIGSSPLIFIKENIPMRSN